MPIQDLPTFYLMRYTEDSGELTGEAYLYNDQMYQALNLAIILLNSITSTLINQGSVTVNGINPPSFTTAEILTLFADATIPVGTIWYNNTLDKLQFKGASAIQTITST